MSLQNWSERIYFSVLLSVLNDDDGRPAPLKRFGSAVFDHANLTAVGFGTLSLETRIVLPSMVAVAGTKVLSLPAIVKSVSGPSFAVRPPSVWSK